MRKSLIAGIILLLFSNIAVAANNGNPSSSRGISTTSAKWYLAEGSTAWGFTTEISILNPNEEEVTVRISYSLPVGEEQVITIPERSQTTVYPQTMFENDFSTTVECLEGLGIAVSRRMSWYSPEGPFDVQIPPGDNSASIGVTAPSKNWYLPEGSSAWGFETWLLIQNPGTQQATVTMTYMIEGEDPLSIDRVIPPMSRETFSMASDIGEKDASILVSSDRDIIAERSMFRNARREGHGSIGAQEPNQDFYLAEGTIGWGYTTYILIQNPQGNTNDIAVTYMTPAGTKEEAFQMPPNSRKTINVNEKHPDLPHPDFSTRVHGSQPIIAERAMYWGNGLWERCHDSIGLAAPHNTFYLPGGWADFEVETWTLVQNPNGSPVTVLVSYLPEGGGQVTEFTDEIPANSRRSYRMADYVEGGYGVIVNSTEPSKPVMAETASYLVEPKCGSCTIGGFSD